MSMSKEDRKNKVLSPMVFEPLCEGNFRKADKDKSGFIDKSEFKDILTAIYEDLQLSPPSDSEVEIELKKLDTNKDNQISRDEFKVLMKEFVIKTIDMS